MNTRNPDQTTLKLSLTAHGEATPTTTSSTAWPQCAGTVLLGRSSHSRLNTRITCAATPTKTTHRCGTHLSPLDSASAAQSPSPTARSASPMTGSKSHHTTAPHARNAQPAADESHTFACNSLRTLIDGILKTT